MALMIDSDTVVHLDNGWHAATATCDSCGDQALILLNPGGGTLSLEAPPHERTGQLPRQTIAAIAQTRCGGIRRNRWRCRSPVSGAGQRCYWHADQRSEQETTR